MGVHRAAGVHSGAQTAALSCLLYCPVLKNRTSRIMSFRNSHTPLNRIYISKVLITAITSFCFRISFNSSSVNCFFSFPPHTGHFFSDRPHFSPQSLQILYINIYLPGGYPPINETRNQIPNATAAAAAKAIRNRNGFGKLVSLSPRLNLYSNPEAWMKTITTDTYTNTWQ